MAHLLEHMMFKGSPQAPEIVARAAGPRRAVQRHDVVRSHELLRDVRRPATRTSSGRIDLEADRMVNAFVAQTDLETEITVVRNEFERARTTRRACSSSACCRPRTSGTTTASRRSAPAATSRTCRSPRCRRSTRSYYQPDNAVLVVAGRSTRARRSRRSRENFGAIPSPTRELDRRYTDEPVQDGEREVTCAASATCRSSWPRITPSPARIRTSCRCRPRRRAGRRAVGPPLQGARRDGARRRDRRERCSRATPAR